MNPLLRSLLFQISLGLLSITTLCGQVIKISELNISFDTEKPQLSAVADQYIQSVVEMMEKDALHRKTLDFDKIRHAIRYYADGADSVEDTHEAIAKVMPLLQDHHSFFMTAVDVKKLLGLNNEDIRTIKAGRAPHIDPQKMEVLKTQMGYAHGKIINGKIGYLSVPSFGHLYYEAMALFADSLQALIRTFDQQGVSGWIIDLRDNGGGADMPMITGLGPLLDSENVYYCVDEEGNEKSRSYYRHGGYYNVDAGGNLGEPLVQSTENYQVRNPGLPVAILTSFKTASSAEAVAAIFAGQSNVKIIGRKTNGLTTVNDFNFLEDNSVLNLTIGYYANRHHELYRQGITPDIAVDVGNKTKSASVDNDLVLNTALEWILK